MSDPRNYTPQGVIVSDTSVVLEGVRAEYRTAFGANLDTSPETPQGMLISMDADGRDGDVRLTAAVANQFNPNLSRGVFLDALCALTGLERRGATRSRVVLTLSGVPGTSIPAGSRVGAPGTTVAFSTVGVSIISANGSVSANALSETFGPVEVQAGALSSVLSPVLGWEGVTNPAPSVRGRLEETDGALRLRRRDTLGLQSVSLLASLRAALLDRPDVQSCAVRENTSSDPQVIDGISMAPHSVWACVDGGTDLDVAETLLSRKSLGADWNGPVSVAVVEPASGQTYEVKFQRPDEVPVFLNVRVAPGSPVADPASAVREAVRAYVQGEVEGEPGLGVGSEVSPFEIAAAINAFNPSLFVRSVFASRTFPATSAETLPMAVHEVARILDGNIQVVVG